MGPEPSDSGGDTHPGERRSRGGREETRPAALLLGGALLTTLLLGAWMRWALAGQVSLPGSFVHLRHAHSHLGYYGVLLPLAWMGWRRAGAPAPGPRLLGFYSGAVLLSFLGFLRAGYGPAAIAGSAAVGAVWLLAAWRLRGRMGAVRDPLALVLPGTVLAEACIPPIALAVGERPDVAQAWVATFLAVLLLVVVVPSALAARNVPAVVSPALTAAGVLGAASLGVWPGWPAGAGLLLYAGWLGWVALRKGLPPHLRAVWGVVAGGLAAMGSGLLPNNRALVLGAIHFLVLSPVLASLAGLWLPRLPSSSAWWLYHGAVALLAAPLLAQGLGHPAATMTLSAVGGTAVLLWWAWAVVRRPRLEQEG